MLCVEWDVKPYNIIQMLTLALLMYFYIHVMLMRVKCPQGYLEIPRKFGNIRWNSSSISPTARDVVTSGLDVCDIYFRYKTTSYNTNLSNVELFDLENMRIAGIAIGILLLGALELEI